MPDLETGRHRLPLLAVSQAQKEITHNEALVLIDALIHIAVENTQSVPPAVTDVDNGKCWLIGAAASGLWANRSGQIAIWTGGGWRFAVPQNGMRLWNKSEGQQSHYVAGQWSNAPLISLPVGGAVIDAEARAALTAILQYLRSIGMCAS
jgi:hypothetical protein